MVPSLRPLRIVATPFLVLASAPVSPAAEGAGAAQDPRVREIVSTIVRQTAELAGQPDAAASAICARQSAALIEIDTVAKAGAEKTWDRMSAAQREAYRGAAQRWIVRKCVERNHENKGERPDVIGLREGESGDLLLATQTREPPRFAIWRLRGAKRLRVVDVILDGVSMSLTLRDQTNALLDDMNGNIDAATKALDGERPRLEGQGSR